MIQPPQIFKHRKAAPSDAKLVEAFESSLIELFFTRHPRFKKGMAEAETPLKTFIAEHANEDIWIYYPWKNAVVHTLKEELYFELRTARNRPLMSEKEQRAFRALSVGIIGLSVGSATSAALAMTGGPRRMRLADYDTVEVSNLNRMHATLLDIGRNKAEVAAQAVWELDPFAKLDVWVRKVDEKTLSHFIAKKPKLDLFIDAMDSLDLKLLAREICRRARIPVLMATSNGDSMIIDIERFDREPSRPLFHGRLGHLSAAKLKELPYPKWLHYATQIVDPKVLTIPMQQALSEIGKTVAAIPQLGTTVVMAGAAVTVAVRTIAAGKMLPSGRYIVGFDSYINYRTGSSRSSFKRRRIYSRFRKKFGHASAL